MPSQYIFYNSQEKWIEREKLLNETLGLVDKVFASEWQVGSVWDCLDTMREAARFFHPEKADADIIEAYQAAMLDQIDYSQWQVLKDKLYSTQSSIGEEKNLQLIEETDLYQNFAYGFKPIAAASAYYHPLGHQIVSVESLDESVHLLERDDLEKIQEKDVWEGIMRFVGQSFFSFDTHVREWVLSFLFSAPLDKQAFEDKRVASFLLVCFYIAARDFKDLTEEDKFAVLNILSWWLISTGVPLKGLLEDDLAGQPNVLYYEFYSGQYAKLILESNTVIFYGAEKAVTVHEFLQGYFLYAGENDLDGLKQMNYVNEKIKAEGWPAQIKNRLLELLNVYLHLREMDLVDYRAILSDSGVIPPRYDWKKVLQTDLTEEDQKAIKRHFSLLMMPTKLKMELIVAFQSLSWKEEPYLSRILILSDLYQDVYNPPYSPLVYFDETDDDWKINKELPDKWVKFSLAYDYKKLIDKMVEQSLEGDKPKDTTVKIPDKK